MQNENMLTGHVGEVGLDVIREAVQERLYVEYAASLTEEERRQRRAVARRRVSG